MAHALVKLVSEQGGVRPSEELTVALWLRMDPEWHVYWRNPGDSGLSPSITWHLPPGFRAGSIHWPTPHRINLGPLTSYGYEGEVLLLTQIRVPPDLKEAPYTINADVSWLTCKVDCIPGKAHLALTLPLEAEKNPTTPDPWQEKFEQTRQALPMPYSAGPLSAGYTGKQWTITLDRKISSLPSLEFFPYSETLIAHAAPQVLTCKQNSCKLVVARSNLSTTVPAKLEGILVSEGKSWEVAIPVAAESPIAAQSVGFWTALMFAFLGGIILNLMPCVLPVLSLKVLGLVKSAQDPRTLWLNALTYALGVIFAFWVVAGALLVLKAAGHQLGWGFQFQSPAFLVGMAVLLLVLGLNMMGLFEVPGIAVSKPISRRGWLEHFSNGVLATVLATPCTAPFMGTAIGFALAQPPLFAILIFTSLGAGLALPFVLLAAFPKALKWVPKPGPWMQTLKKVLGAIMILCAVWLGWIFVVSKGWAIHATTKQSSKIPWQPFSTSLLQQTLAQKQAVFIDFTAAWCLTCQVNDRLVFEQDAVAKTFREYDIVALKADWTKYDPEITQALAAYGKNSIPLYVLYVPGKTQPIILPEIITPGLVIETIRSSL